MKKIKKDSAIKNALILLAQIGITSKTLNKISVFF